MSTHRAVDQRSLPIVRALFLIVLLLSVSSGIAGEEGWVVLGHPTTRDLRRADFIDPMTGWAVGDSGTVVMTSDGGVTWTTQNSGTEFDIIDISIVGGQYGWFLAQQYPVDTIQEYGTELFRTTDGGETWFFQERFDEFYFHAVEFTDEQNGFLGGNLGRILWTENSGNIWNTAVIDSPDFARWPIWRFDFYNPGYGMAMGGLFDVTGLVWRTTDGGKFWTHRRVAGEPIFDCHFFDSLNVLCVSGDIDFGSGMVRTLDGGLSWVYTYLGIWGQATSVSFRTPTEGWSTLGFASTYMTSFDAGETWGSSFTPDSTAMFDVTFLDSTVGYMVGADGTVLKYFTPPVAVSDDGSVLPEEPGLGQNYPNPFNATSNFEFRIVTAGDVSLKIFDLLGQEVTTVVDEVLPPGRYKRSFDGKNLSSGLYLYRLTTAGYSETRKMVLLR